MSSETFNIISTILQTFTLGSLLVIVFKSGMFVSETRSEIRRVDDKANRAHKRIDKIEET